MPVNDEWDDRIDAPTAVVVILICLVIGLFSVGLAAPELECGVDPDEPCLGSGAWHSVSTGTMLLFIGSCVYFLVRVWWFDFTGRQFRYRRTLAFGLLSYAAFLGSSLAYAASWP